VRFDVLDDRLCPLVVCLDGLDTVAERMDFSVIFSLSVDGHDLFLVRYIFIK